MEIELLQKLESRSQNLENLQPNKWRWIDFLCEEAETTMERDWKLFEEVKKKGFPAVLRFYSWKEATLSFGRTQGIDTETFSKYAEEGWKIVKRPTGGGKVFHKNDLCFSLIWKKENNAIPWGVKDSYCAIHGWVRESLRRMGVHSQFWDGKIPYLNGNSLRTHIPASGGCFETPVENDLLCEGKKIVGGAQWRDGHVALHQGSVQIAPEKLDLEIFKQKFCEMFSVQFLSPTGSPSYTKEENHSLC